MVDGQIVSLLMDRKDCLKEDGERGKDVTDIHAYADGGGRWTPSWSRGTLSRKQETASRQGKTINATNEAEDSIYTERNDRVDKAEHELE